MIIGLNIIENKQKVPLGAFPVVFDDAFPVLQQFNIESCIQDFAAIMADLTGWPISADVLSSTKFPIRWDDNKFLRTYTILDKVFNVEFLLDEKELRRYWNELASNGLFSGSVLRCNPVYDKAPGKPCERFGLVWSSIEIDQHGKQYAIVINPELIRESIQISAHGKIKLFQSQMAIITRNIRSISGSDIKHVTLI